MSWEGLREDIEEMFARLEGVPEMGGERWFLVVNDEAQRQRARARYEAKKAQILAQQKEYRRRNRVMVALNDLARCRRRRARMKKDTCALSVQC